MKARKDVHIGREIERVLHERGITVTEFANRICCHRKNVYDIFTRKSIDIDRLIRISEALDQTAAILKALITDGVTVNELYITRLSLEDYYLTITGGKYDA